MNPGLAIIGFMGAGKSTVAATVAGALELPLVDTDAGIERLHGAIGDIFARKGEGAFRALERDAACAALASCLDVPAVVALGGGAVTIPDVREALSRLAHVVWIDAPLSLLYARAGASGTRPLARDRHAFEALYRERRPLYAGLATVTVVTAADEPVDAVAQRVIEAVATDVIADGGRRAEEDGTTAEERS